MDCLIGLVGILAAFVLGKFLSPIQISIVHEKPASEEIDIDRMQQMETDVEELYKRNNELQNTDAILQLMKEFQLGGADHGDRQE